MNFIISIDGAPGVGKTNFTTDLADAISYRLAQRACESFTLRYMAPKGTRLCWDTDPVGVSDRAALKRIIQSFVSGARIDCPATRADEVVESLIYTQNVCSYVDALRCATHSPVDKTICFIDGGFVSLQCRFGRDCSDFIHKIDASVILFDDPEKLVERAVKKKKSYSDEDRDLGFVSNLIERYKNYIQSLDESVRKKTYVVDYNNGERTTSSESPSKRWARRVADEILKNECFLQ